MLTISTPVLNSTPLLSGLRTPEILNGIMRGDTEQPGTFPAPALIIYFRGSEAG